MKPNKIASAIRIGNMTDVKNQVIDPKRQDIG